MMTCRNGDEDDDDELPDGGIRYIIWSIGARVSVK